MIFSVYVGIDPGLKGGLTAISGGGVIFWCIPMPVITDGKKNLLDSRMIANKLRELPLDTIVVIEKVHSMPKQSVSSMFTFGYGAGVLEGVCAALNLRYVFVAPQTWMKSVLADMPGGVEKSSIAFCKRFFNQDFLATPRSKVPHDGMTDSACMALYGLKEYGSSQPKGA